MTFGLAVQNDSGVFSCYAEVDLPFFHAAGQQASSHFKIDAAGISLSGITRSHRNKADMIHTIHTIHTLLSEPLEWPQMYSCCLL